jgi:hypothetical protein
VKPKLYQLCLTVPFRNDKELFFNCESIEGEEAIPEENKKVRYEAEQPIQEAKT